MGENSTKIFSFPDAGAAATNNGLAAMLPALLQNQGINPAYLMGMLNNGNGGFFGNNGGFQDIIALIVIAAIFGNGSFGFGGSGNGRGDAERQMLMDAIQRNGVDIAQLASTVGCSKDQIIAGINTVSNAICNQSAQMGQNTNQIITALMQGNNALASQLAQCCCDQRLAICQQTNTLVTNANTNTLAIRDAATANTNAIIAKLDAAEMRAMRDKLDALRERNSSLVAQLSNEHQTAAIQAYQAQVIAPVNAALGDLSQRLAAIECKQPASVTIPYIPAMSNLVPVSYSQPVNFGVAPYTNGCNC